MSVELQIDEQSLRHVNKQLDILKKRGDRSAYSAIVKVLLKIKTEAQLRLTGRGHIVTSRLKNSVYVQGATPINTPDNKQTYSDNNGKTFNSMMKSVQLKEGEAAVGTNVEYGEKIETLDSFLYWALKNVNIEQETVKDMQDFMKFGPGLIPNK